MEEFKQQLKNLSSRIERIRVNIHTEDYFNVLLDDNIRKWICRLGFNGTNKYIQLNDAKRTNIKIDSVNDILDYKEEILTLVGQFESVSSK
jgi:predicted type IV restriction endonuclease